MGLRYRRMFSFKKNEPHHVKRPERCSPAPGSLTVPGAMPSSEDTGEPSASRAAVTRVRRRRPTALSSPGTVDALTLTRLGARIGTIKELTRYACDC